MATASRQVRKVRRIKRDRSQAYRMLDTALAQRNQARMFAGALEKELQKYIDKFGEIVPEPVTEDIPGTNSVLKALEANPSE